MWYEIGSHAGKPVPVVSVFPPFSLAYNCAYAALWGLPSPDADNVWFHHCHHVFYTGNYGITPVKILQRRLNVQRCTATGLDSHSRVYYSANS